MAPSSTKPALYLAISNEKPVIPLFAKKANLRLVFGSADVQRDVQGAQNKTEDAPKQKPLLAPNRHDYYPH